MMEPTNTADSCINQRILCYNNSYCPDTTADIDENRQVNNKTSTALIQLPGQIHRTEGFKSARHYRWREKLYQQGLKWALQAQEDTLGSFHLSFTACFHHWVRKHQLDKAFVSRYIYFQTLTYLSGQDAAKQVAMDTIKEVEASGYFANMNFIAATQYIFLAIRNINSTNLAIAEEFIQKACLELQYTEVSEWKAELYQCLCRYHLFCSFQETAEEQRISQAETAMRFALLSIETNNLCIRGYRNPSNDILHALKINFALPLTQRNISEAEKLFERALKYQSKVKVIQGEEVLIGLFLLLYRCCIHTRKAQFSHLHGSLCQAQGHCTDALIWLTGFFKDSREACESVTPGTKQEESYCEALKLYRYLLQYKSILKEQLSAEEKGRRDTRNKQRSLDIEPVDLRLDFVETRGFILAPHHVIYSVVNFDIQTARQSIKPKKWGINDRISVTQRRARIKALPSKSSGDGSCDSHMTSEKSAMEEIKDTSRQEANIASSDREFSDISSAGGSLESDVLSN